MAELQQLNGSLEQTVQQYDSAKLHYQRVERELKLNRQEFKVAKRNLKISQRNIAARLVITNRKKKGQHPSPATVLRMLREHDEKTSAAPAND